MLHVADTASDPVLVASWNTYEPGGHQAWLYANGRIDAATEVFESSVIRPVGLRFEALPGGAEIIRDRWGVYTLERQGCARIDLAYAADNGGFGSGTQQLQRITTPLGLAGLLTVRDHPAAEPYGDASSTRAQLPPVRAGRRRAGLDTGVRCRNKSAETGGELMDQQQIKEFKELLDRRYYELREQIRHDLEVCDQEQYAELAGKVHDLEDEALADLLVDVNLAHVDRHLEELNEVNAALRRIREGTYGICVDTGEEIELERLRAYPTAIRTREAQERYERGHSPGGHSSL